MIEHRESNQADTKDEGSVHEETREHAQTTIDGPGVRIGHNLDQQVADERHEAHCNDEMKIPAELSKQDPTTMASFSDAWGNCADHPEAGRDPSERPRRHVQHRQKADERGSGHQRRRKRRMPKHCGSKRDAGDALGNCGLEWYLGTLEESAQRRTATQWVKFWETCRQHQLQQGDLCTHWNPPTPLESDPACGQQHQDDVRGSQRECLSNWPSARLAATALRFSSTNRPTQMEDSQFSHMCCVT